MRTFDDTAVEELYFREAEPYRNQKAFTLKAVIPNGGALVSAWLQIDTSGDFLCESLTGSAQGPVNSAGLWQKNSATDFPMAGTTTGWADRGVLLSIVDVGRQGIQYTAVQGNLNIVAAGTSYYDRIPFGALAAPGYASAGESFALGSLYRPQPFKVLFPKGALIRFDFRNLDAQAGLYHRVDLVLKGKRYVDA